MKKGPFRMRRPAGLSCPNGLFLCNPALKQTFVFETGAVRYKKYIKNIK